MPMSIDSGEHSRSSPTTVASKKIVFSKTASWMKPGVDKKQNSPKHALTRNATYMANTITKFVEGSF